MPRNNGIYTAPPSNWSPAVDGNPATPDDWNMLLEDISQALTQSLSRDGQSAMTGALPMGNQRIINLGAATANTDALRRSAIIKGAAIESAQNITIPAEGVMFDVTGSATIQSISGAFDGKFAFLRFAESLTIEATASIIPPGDGDYITSEGELMVFVRVAPNVWQAISAGGGDGFRVGDYLDTARIPDSRWLRRDGATYDAVDYPALAALLPPLPTTVEWGEAALPGTISAVHDAIPYKDIGVAALVSIDGADNNLFVGVYNGSSWSTFVSANMPNVPLYLSTRHRIIDLSTEDNDLFSVSSGMNGISVSSNLVDWDQKYNGSGEVEMVDYISDGDVAVSIHWMDIPLGPRLRVITDFDSVPPYYDNLPGIPAGTKLNAIRKISGKYYVVGEGGLVASSVDLINGGTWIPESTGTTSEIFDIAGDENHIVAATATGLIINSGSGWSAVPGATRAMHGIVLNESGYIAVGPSGYCYTASKSADLFSETRTPSNVGATRIGAFGQDNFVFMTNGLIDRSGVKSVPVAEKSKPTSFKVPNDNPSSGWIKAL